MEVKGYKEEGRLSCIFCGIPLKGTETTMYRGWHCHPDCAKKAHEERLQNFNRWYFWIGALATPIAIIFSIPLIQNLLQGLPVYDPIVYIVPFAGFSLSLVIQSIGHLGFYKNFTRNMGFICFLVSCAGAFFYLSSSVVLLTEGYNPIYYDPASGELQIYAILGLPNLFMLQFGIVSLLMTLFAYVLILTYDDLGERLIYRIYAVIAIGCTILFTLSPLNIIVEMLLVGIVFLTVNIPTLWLDDSPM